MQLDGCIIINRDDRPDRLAHCWRELDRLNANLTVERLPGCTVPAPDHWKQTPGGYRCLIAHINALKYAHALGWENTLIVEDDVEFHFNFHDKFTAFLRELPDDWQGIYLGPSFRPFPEKRKYRPKRELISKHVIRCWGARSAQARIWRRSCLEPMITALERGHTGKRSRRNDRCSAMFQIDNPAFPIYAPEESLSWQHPSPSNTTGGRIVHHSTWCYETRYYTGEAFSVSKLKKWPGVEEGCARWLAAVSSRRRVVVSGELDNTPHQKIANLGSRLFTDYARPGILYLCGAKSVRQLQQKNRDPEDLIVCVGSHLGRRGVGGLTYQLGWE